MHTYISHVTQVSDTALGLIAGVQGRKLVTHFYCIYVRSKYVVLDYVHMYIFAV